MSVQYTSAYNSSISIYVLYNCISYVTFAARSTWHVKVKSYMARSNPEENLYYHRLWGQLSTIFVVMLPQWTAPSCSRSHPHPSQGSTPELHLPGANAGHKSQDLLQPVGRERATCGMPGHRTACAATQLQRQDNLFAALLV